MLNAFDAGERHFREMLENVRLIAVTLDVQGNVTFCNNFLLEVMAWRREELLGRNWFETVVPDPAPVRAMFEQATRDGSLPFHYENEVLTRRGERRTVHWNNTLLRDSANRILGTVSLGEDITGRKTAEARIGRLTQLYAALSQCNAAIVRCASEEELFPQICRAAVQYGGMKMAWIGLVDAASRRVRPVDAFGEGVEFLEGIEISADPGSQFGRGAVGTAIRENRPVWCQDYLNDPTTAPWHERAARAGWNSAATLPLRRNGAVIGTFVLASGEVNPFDDAVRGLLVNMALDISYALDHFFHESERRKAEEALRESDARYRALFERNPLPIFALDKETLGFLAINQAAIDKYGYSREEFLAMTILDLQVPEDRAHVDAELREQYARAPDEIRHRERRHIRKNGQIIFANVVAQPLRLDGRQARLVSVSDVTERKLHEDELRRLNEELERRVEQRTRALQAANGELEAFSYSVSHDLRAPLRAINGFGHVIEDEYAEQLGERGMKLLGQVRAGAERMGHLIEDLLKLSQISRRAIHVTPVDLSALAREAAEELQAEEPGRRVEWAIARGVTADGDAGLLKVVLQNLIGNAWKYSSRRGTARIEFGVVERQGRPEYFVRDNGAGFDMAHAQKLFGAFQRLHTPAEFPGSGIGLATVARVIHRHGGDVRAEGRVGEGASFYFTLWAASVRDPGREESTA